MNIADRPEILLALVLAPAGMYACLYLALRLAGVLRVGARGWHAGGVWMGERIVLSAPGLFGLFQPLMRLESGVARRLSRTREEPRERAVSEVVVEVIPFL